jgi:hypothetical protein
MPLILHITEVSSEGEDMKTQINSQQSNNKFGLCDRPAVYFKMMTHEVSIMKMQFTTSVSWQTSHPSSGQGYHLRFSSLYDSSPHLVDG